MELSGYGGLLLGSRLRRLSEALYGGVDEIYRAHGVELSSRSFPILFFLRDDGPMGVTELAARLGQSHPGVIRMSRKLLDEGLVTESQDRADERRRLLVLSRKGRALMTRMEPLWRAVSAAVDALSSPSPSSSGASGGELLSSVSALERALAERDFAARIEELLRVQAGAAVEIVAYEPRYRDDFKRLNVEWLEKYFYVEEIDHQVLSHPQEEIIAPGGFIFLARLGTEIVGTVALIRRPRGRFELSKMAVTERYRGMRIGYELFKKAVAHFETLDAKGLFLETNSKLAPALRLYEANGFRRAPRPKGAVHYQRSDVYMVYTPGKRAG